MSKLAVLKDNIKNFGLDANRALKDTQAASLLLGSMANPYANQAGAVLGALGYGRRKPKARKPKAKAGGAKKKPSAAAKKRAAARKKLKKAMQGAGFFDFLKNVASVPIMAAGGTLGGLNAGIQGL